MRAVARKQLPTEIARRATIPTALVRDILSVGLLVEYRASARSRLEQLLGPDTAARVVRQTLASGHG